MSKSEKVLDYALNSIPKGSEIIVIHCDENSPHFTVEYKYNNKEYRAKMVRPGKWGKRLAKPEYEE
jgi:hypothetical protein